MTDRRLRGWGRADFRLNVRAIMQGWALTAERRREIVERLYLIASDPDVEPRYSIPAAKACMAADALASQHSGTVLEAEFERIDDENIEAVRKQIGEQLARLGDERAIAELAAEVGAA